MQSSPLGAGGGSALPVKKRSRAPRTVADLTDEQVRHKRTVDRKAQRASRQRTKDSILELKTHFARLQETRAEQAAELVSLREQNSNLQRCLDSIQGILSGAQSAPGDSGAVQSSPNARGDRELAVRKCFCPNKQYTPPSTFPILFPNIRDFK